MISKLSKWLMLLAFVVPVAANAQDADPWMLKADKIDPANYYGITVANGMIKHIIFLKTLTSQTLTRHSV